MSTGLEKVRIEDESSVGRSYSKRGQMKAGLGAARRALRTSTFHPEKITTKAVTLHKINHRTASREDVMEAFHNSWELTDCLFTSLKDDSVFYMIPDKLRRPLIFYFGHTAALYANKFNFVGLTDNINVYYQKLLETGVDEMSWDDMDDMQCEDFCWPSVAEVQAFRDRVKKLVEDVIMEMPEPKDQPLTMDSPYWVLMMGFEHEHIHLETSSVLIRQNPAEVPANNMVAVPEGTAVLGKPENFPSFGWDNEYGKRVVEVPAFEAAQFITTNAEFLPFVLANGYRQKKYWVSPQGDDEGWRWVTFRNATHPSFWVATSDMPEYFGGKPDYPYQKDDGHELAGSGKEFKYRAMFDIIDMPWDWPVEVNYLEARAFLNWKQEQDGAVYRMPTEAEYHRIRGDASIWPEATPGKTPAGPGADLSDPLQAVDIIMQPEAPGNINLRYGSSSPVDAFPPSSTGFYDVHGNVWEWVEDHFGPLPGFKIHYTYDDFSTPCFDGWHTENLGGSWISVGELASNFARYHFRRHFFQHLGFRYVKVADPKLEPYPGAATVNNLWEGKDHVSKQITNHFGDKTLKLPQFLNSASLESGFDYPRLVADLCRGLRLPKSARVLHLGCSVGAVTFALTSLYEQVVGVDSSEPFIRHARILQHHGQIDYERVEEGVLREATLVTVPESAIRSRATFVTDDLEALTAATHGDKPYDLVVVDCVLEQSVQPLNIVNQLRSDPRILKAGGHLVMLNSCDWDPKVTPRNSWLGGFSMNGEDMKTLDMLHCMLKRNFDLLQTADVPKLTRCHARRFELNVIQASVWTKVDAAAACCEEDGVAVADA